MLNNLSQLLQPGLVIAHRKPIAALSDVQCGPGPRHLVAAGWRSERTTRSRSWSCRGLHNNGSPISIPGRQRGTFRKEKETVQMLENGRDKMHAQRRRGLAHLLLLLLMRRRRLRRWRRVQLTCVGCTLAVSVATPAIVGDVLVPGVAAAIPFEPRALDHRCNLQVVVLKTMRSDGVCGCAHELRKI